MKNIKTIMSLMILSLILVPAFVFAQGSQTQADPAQRRAIESVVEELDTENIDEVTEMMPTIQNRAEVNIQNQGEQQMLRVEAGEQLMVGQEEDGTLGIKAQNQVQGEPQVASQAQNQFQGSNAPLESQQRRSMVANAVQEMLQLAERNPGIGQQISLIAQSQNQAQEQAEAMMAEAKNRGQLRILFFGPDYKKLDLAKNNLTLHEEKINELKALVTTLDNPEEADLLNEQIIVMENVHESLAGEINSELSRPSLFGWFKRLFKK